MKRFAVFVALAVLASGCAGPQRTGSNFEPVVDVRAGQYEVYKKDLGECQAYATRVLDAAQGAMTGALLGALIGAMAGAATGTSRNNMAGYGAGYGIAAGAATAETNQRNIIRRCLAGRGYSVLN